MAKVVPGVGVATRSETLHITFTGERARYTFGHLEVFAVPLFCVWGFLQPLFIFWNGEEIASLISFLNFLALLSRLQTREIIILL